jgi:glutathione S-transferase
MYKLIGMSGVGSRKNRVCWMLEEINAQYEAIDTVPHSEIALSVNPSGVLPALRDGDNVITDSAAICTYLADTNPQFGFSFPSGTAQRAEMEGWSYMATSDLEGPIWTAIRQLNLPEEERLQEVLNLANEDWVKAVGWLEKKLGDNQYVMGDTFTVPDLFFGHVGFWAKFYDFPVDSQTVQAYFNRLITRPAFKKTMSQDLIATAALKEKGIEL